MADQYNHRVVVCNVVSVTNGQEAVAVLGQSNFTSGGAATSATGVYRPTGVTYDAGAQRLFVADYSNHRVVVHNVGSITNGQSAVDDWVNSIISETSVSRGTSVTETQRPKDSIGHPSRFWIPWAIGCLSQTITTIEFWCLI